MTADKASGTVVAQPCALGKQGQVHLFFDFLDHIYQNQNETWKTEQIQPNLFGLRRAAASGGNSSWKMTFLKKKVEAMCVFLQKQLEKMCFWATKKKMLDNFP